MYFKVPSLHNPLIGHAFQVISQSRFTSKRISGIALLQRYKSSLDSSFSIATCVLCIPTQLHTPLNRKRASLTSFYMIFFFFNSINENHKPLKCNLNKFQKKWIFCIGCIWVIKCFFISRLFCTQETLQMAKCLIYWKWRSFDRQLGHLRTAEFLVFWRIFGLKRPFFSNRPFLAIKSSLRKFKFQGYHDQNEASNHAKRIFALQCIRISNCSYINISLNSKIPPEKNSKQINWTTIFNFLVSAR